MTSHTVSMQPDMEISDVNSLLMKWLYLEYPSESHAILLGENSDEVGEVLLRQNRRQGTIDGWVHPSQT